jgi:hypothetical protein
LVEAEAIIMRSRLVATRAVLGARRLRFFRSSSRSLASAGSVAAMLPNITLNKSRGIASGTPRARG